MKVTISFDSRDDLHSVEEGVSMKDRIEGTCLTIEEAETAEWFGRTLTYRSDRAASQIIDDWEDEGFNIDEFFSFGFSR
jgi:hypothetical protein